MIISILTGFAAGAIHVVGGADHIIAMAPSGFLNPKGAIRKGFAWGIGHSMGVLILASIAIVAKDLIHIKIMSSFAELIVGITLLAIGAITIKSSLGLNIHTHQHLHSNGVNHEHLHLHFRGRKKHKKHSHRETSLGIIHGMAGASHLLAVIPALALPPLGAITYLFAYLGGSLISMIIIVLIISLATLRMGKRTLPLFFASTGFLSILTGFFWIHKTYIEIL